MPVSAKHFNYQKYRRLEMKGKDVLIYHELGHINQLNVKLRFSAWCTDACWIIPFVICLGLFIFVCSDALSKGDLSNLVSLPDLNGHLCGHGINRDKPFLYFCMQQSSQWVFQGNDKRLDMANPVCVGICPGTYNTSTRCWLPLNQTYQWVQDYPTQPFIGFLCRPSRKFTSALSDQVFGDQRVAWMTCATRDR
eukprot:s2136_g2.t1